jgi:hypothetical protein
MSEDPSSYLSIEDLWDALLSRQADRVRSAYCTLDAEQQRFVLTHLKRMTQEPGYHLEQQISAQAALEALE